MDILKVRTKATNMIFEEMVKRAIKKKFGASINLRLQDLQISHNEGETYSIHLEANAAIPESDILKFLSL